MASKFTPDVVAQIPGWVLNGDSKDTMAHRVGVTVDTFAVTCSRLGISLRPSHYPQGSAPAMVPIREETSEKLKKRCKELRMPYYMLAAWLLDLVCQDGPDGRDLIDAILDLDE